MRVPIFLPGEPFFLPADSAATHQPRVGEEVADVGKTPDVVDLVEQDERQTPTPGIERRR